MLEINISTEVGDVSIREDELPTITDDDLKMLRISRQDLVRVFAEGRELMRGKTQADRVRPVADETLDGKWVVHLVRYSARNDPLMSAPAKGHRYRM